MRGRYGTDGSRDKTPANTLHRSRHNFCDTRANFAGTLVLEQGAGRDPNYTRGYLFGGLGREPLGGSVRLERRGRDAQLFRCEATQELVHSLGRDVPGQSSEGEPVRHTHESFGNLVRRRDRVEGPGSFALLDYLAKIAAPAQADFLALGTKVGGSKDAAHELDPEQVLLSEPTRVGNGDVDQQGEPRHRITFFLKRGLKTSIWNLVRPAKSGQEDLVLRLEVIVDGSGRDTRAAGDVHDPSRLESSLGQSVPRCREDAFFPFIPDESRRPHVTNLT
jgi:hypothetical protein